VTRHLRPACQECGPVRNYDAVLLPGPLYHLTERADGVRALAEARRVTRPGGIVAAAVISGGFVHVM
jgi:predicted SAM-dependent methyltransferase